MLKRKPEIRSISVSVRLLLSFYFLLVSLIPAGAVPDVTYYPGDYVSSGTYLSGSIPASLRAVDSDYFTVGSYPSATSGSSYSPSAHNLIGGTAHVSGATSDLVSDNDVSMVYRSYPSVTSAQALYAHQEATTIGGSSYYTQRPEASDMAGASLSASMAAVGRQLLGRFVYPLVGVSSIPASTWAGFYRSWRDPDPVIAYDSMGSGNNGDGAGNITWTHVVGSGSNRFFVIGVSIRTVTVSVLGVSFGGQSAVFLRSDVRGAEVKGEIWYLVNPDSGSKVVTVTLSGFSKASGGSVSYSGVAQASPIDNHRSVSYGGVDPSMSLTTTVNNSWVFSNLAVSGTATVTGHSGGQVHRYYEVGTGGGGSSRAGADGDDKPTTTAGSYTLFWNMSFWSDVIAQAVAFKPAPSPVGHVDIDVLVRRAGGAVSTTIATNVMGSTDLTSVPATLLGTYSMATYTVVDQTDFLEVEYYLDVTSATSGVAGYLRIDDDALSVGDQTRVGNVLLPSEYTAEVEYTGVSDAFTWTQVLWVVDSAWTIGSVAVSVQLYNYTLGRYSTSGNGFISYTTAATPNADELVTQTITANPQHFRDAGGNWKIKVEGVNSVNAPFDFKADWVEFRPTYYSEYVVSTEFLFSSLANNSVTQLDFLVVSEYGVAGVSVVVQVWNFSASAYTIAGQGYLRYVSSGVNETGQLSLNVNQQFYVSDGTARIRVTNLLSTTTPFQQRINLVSLGCNYVTPPGSWTWALLYGLPVPFAFLFLGFLWWRRRKNDKMNAAKRLIAFSEQFGLTHEQMTGRKMLLEVDPTSDYNVAVSGFVSEAERNGEPVFIVTNKNSPLHSVFSQAGNANFLLWTSKTHYPIHVSDRETLLPASDLSVLLDTCLKIQQAHAGKTVNLLVDNVSDVILRCGFDKTYKFTRLLLESAPSPNVTALFIFVPTAHDQEVSSSIRSLFHTQLAYTKDGPKAGNT